MSASGALYIYYRLVPDGLAGLEASLRAMQSGLAAQFGCRTQLMRKPADDTVMEVYDPVAEAAPLLDTMGRHLDAMKFDQYLASGSQRHVEFFVCV